MTTVSHPWSLRRRLTVRVLAFVLVGWLGTVAASAVVLDHEIDEMFDEELQALVETTILYLDTGRSTGIPRTMGVETNDGKRVLRIVTPDAEEAPAPWPVLSSDGFHDAPGWRILRRTAEGSVIEAAHSTRWRREEMIEAATAFLVLAVPLIALLLLLLRRIAAEATQPVVALAATVAGRRPDDLSPVGSAGLPRELRPLADAFDSFLSRIEALRRAERDFVANAAHELRTPLAALRGRLELSQDPDAAAAVTTADALTRRVDRLLQLARIEAGVVLGKGPSDLVRILRMLIDEFRTRARHPIQFDDHDLDSLMIAVDPDALAIILRNLIENALEHGTGEVRIKVSPDGGLTIQNPAPGIPLPDARFVSGKASSGLGLGLSIVEALTRAMNVEMTFTSDVGVFRFELRFELAESLPSTPLATMER